MPAGGAFYDQSCFPWLDGYPDDMRSALPDAMAEAVRAEEHHDLLHVLLRSHRRHQLVDALAAEALDLAQAVGLAKGIFPSGSSRHVVIVGDGQETTGSLEQMAGEAVGQGRLADALRTGEEPGMRHASRARGLLLPDLLQNLLEHFAIMELFGWRVASLTGAGAVRWTGRLRRPSGCPRCCDD